MRKRLNNKGFTLIELLAVIVILALIMVIAIPNVLSSMNNSRVSSLHSKAKSVVSWYNDTVLGDALVDASGTKTLDTNDVSAITNSNGTWICIGALTTGFATAAELDSTNYVLGNDTTTDKPSDVGAVSNATTCSAIRTKNGKVEVVLVAAANGKFAVPGKTVTYAYTGDTTGKTA